MLVYCCPDLMFSSKVRGAADAMGIPSRPARDVQALQNRLDKIDDGKLNDPVTGVVIDLGLGDIGLEMIRLVKQRSPSIPVVAYGSHMATDLLQSARTNGADFVMANSQFTANLPVILERFKSIL